MINNNWLFGIMISDFIIYNLTILILYGFLTSISVSYYSLPEKFRNVIFLLFCWSYAMPAMIMSNTPLMFFSGFFICGVGIFSDFRISKYDSNMHQVSAALAITFSQLSILLEFNQWQVNIVFLILGGILFALTTKFKQWMTILEIISFLCIAYVLFQSRINT